MIKISELSNDIAFKKDLLDKRYVIFVGSGVVSATGIPTWDDLLIRLFKNTKDIIKNTEIEESIKKIEDNKNGKDVTSDNYPYYPNVAQEIYNEIGKGNFNSQLDNLLRTTLSPYAAGQIEIIEFARWIVTTNFV